MCEKIKIEIVVKIIVKMLMIRNWFMSLSNIFFRKDVFNNIYSFF